MKELVVISGKGGTGKTSLAAALAVLAGRCVIADCDVDAADLHLIMSPQIVERHDFFSGHEAVIRAENCTGCGACISYCRAGAITRESAAPEHTDTARRAGYTCQTCDYCRRSCPAQIDEMMQVMTAAVGPSRSGGVTIDPIVCEGCGVCVRFCPEQAIDFRERRCGEWFISQTRCGPMVHAKLGIAQSNSGKLVSLVRQRARALADRHQIDLVVIDGSPGIGCPVIASITGASLVLVVTEPTLSGEHDLKRVVQLTRQLAAPVAVCINKWDLNPEISKGIEAWCQEQSIPLAGRIRYDRDFTHAQIQSRTVVESGSPEVTEDVRSLWARLNLA